MSAPPQPQAGVIVGHALRHESAHLHVNGSAEYIDDIALPAGAPSAGHPLVKS